MKSTDTTDEKSITECIAREAIREKLALYCRAGPRGGFRLADDYRELSLGRVGLSYLYQGRLGGAHQMIESAIGDVGTPKREDP
jgi:hypothetical protein